MERFPARTGEGEARLQNFESYDIAHAPLRGDALTEGGVRLLIDLGRFDIATDQKAVIALSAKLIDAGGHLTAARIFNAHIQTVRRHGRCHGRAGGAGVRDGVRHA